MNTSTNNSSLNSEFISVGKHSSIYLLGQFLSRGIGFLMIPVYTQFISPDGYGALELMDIFAGAIGIGISFGISEGMPRFYYGENDTESRSKLVSSAFIGLAAVSILPVFILLMYSSKISWIVADGPQCSHYLRLSLATIWFTLICDFGFSYLRMIYRATLFICITSFQLILGLTLNIWFVVFKKMGIDGILYSAFITQLLTALFLGFIVLRKVGFWVSLSSLRKMIAFGVPLIPGRIASIVGFMSNRWFLRWLGSGDPTVALVQVGLFALGHKFGVIINRFVTVPFNSFWNPRRLEILISEDDACREIVSRVCTYATLLSVYLTLILSCCAKSIIEIMADGKYSEAYVVVPFVALSYVLLGLETHFSSGILYKKKSIWIACASIVSIFTIVVLNLLLIPAFGILGAAISNLIGFFVRLTVIYIMSQRLYLIPFDLKRLTLIFGVAFILYMSTQQIKLPNPYYSLMVNGSIAATLPGLLLVLRFYSPDELSMFCDMLRAPLSFLKGIIRPC